MIAAILSTMIGDSKEQAVQGSIACPERSRRVQSSRVRFGRTVSVFADHQALAVIVLGHRAPVGDTSTFREFSKHRNEKRLTTTIGCGFFLAGVHYPFCPL